MLSKVPFGRCMLFALAQHGGKHAIGTPGLQSYAAPDEGTGPVQAGALAQGQ